jgi:cytochrome oxidase assembly protein ShyY1
MSVVTGYIRRWWLFTLIILAAVALCIWAGFWQMDRREQKRAINLKLVERWQMAPFDVNREPLPADLEALAYRRIQATGRFDYERQIVRKGVSREIDGAPGSYLVTPLVFDNGRAILVARGWVPTGQDAPAFWSQFNEPANVSVIGLIQSSETLPNATPPTQPQTDWFRIDVEAIQAQLPYELLPAFILMMAEPGRPVDVLPYRIEEPPLADELMHLSYTVQWFAFALIAAGGYVIFVVQQERKRRLGTAPVAESGSTAELPTLPNQA